MNEVRAFFKEFKDMQMELPYISTKASLPENG
jgi:hypothetical protein